MVLAGCASTEPTQPNVLLIVADDLGQTDLGFMGSEIRTPNLDRLASEGRVYTNFLVTPACSPTRAMLLTGRDPHLVGFGTMAGEHSQNQRGAPGYEGHLTAGHETVATSLQAAGYFTCMAGKWHLGMGPGQGPERRGFERSFALMPGGASHFSDAFRLVHHPEPAPYREDGRPVSLPPDFFSTDAYTDKLMGYAAEAPASAPPFFMYAAYTAPHWPLHVPDEWLDRYRGVYDEGWDVLRERRGGGATSGPWSAPAWRTLPPEERRREARKMEVYAAMVENLDHNIGRLLDALRASGQLENTVVLFFSDNGPEGNDIERLAKTARWPEGALDHRFESIGRRGTYTWLGPGWAHASAAPYRLFKAYPTQGGVRVPAVVSYPGHVAAGRTDRMVTAKDVAPTLLELAGGARAKRSLLRSVEDPDHVMGWELFGRRAIQKGHWKLTWMAPPFGAGRWELHDLSRDPAESRDLSAERPAKRAELIKNWSRYAREHGVVLPAQDMGYGNWRRP